ncbi:MAG: hypothetical protein ACPGXZ_00820 [Saprospiraceae bacterium]
MEELNELVPFFYGAEDNREGICCFYALANLTGERTMINIAKSKEDGYLTYEINHALRDENIAVYDVAIDDVGFPFFSRSISKWSSLKNGSFVPLLVNIASKSGQHAIAVFWDIHKGFVYVLDSSVVNVQRFHLAAFTKFYNIKRVAVLLDKDTKSMIIAKDYIKR